MAAVVVNKPTVKFETEDDRAEEAVIENLVRGETVEECFGERGDGVGGGACER